MTDPTREQEDQDRVQCETFNPPMREDGKAPWEQEDQGTPRTEEVKFLALGVNRAHLQEVVQIDFARQLERDLNASRSAGRREGLEEAAKVCDMLQMGYTRLAKDALATGNVRLGHSQLAAERCALGIRALASAQPQQGETSGKNHIETTAAGTQPEMHDLLPVVQDAARQASAPADQQVQGQDGISADPVTAQPRAERRMNADGAPSPTAIDRRQPRAKEPE